MTPLDISLTDLISRLDDEFDAADDLARIGEARLRAQTLADLGEQLVGHYVGKAKQAGATWSEIGDAIGVSKQAAQQRHAPAPFERFTRLSRHAIVLAQEAARTHRHDSIGPEHLLLGLLGEPQGLAHRLLDATTGSAESVRAAIEAAMAPDGEKMPRGHIAFRPETKQVIEQAARASGDLGHDFVGTEHLLLGVLRVEDSVAARVLHDHGFTADTLATTVRDELAKGHAARQGTSG